MSEYRMTIGLEIHAELKTKTKMFCGCVNLPEEKIPNIHICPVCMGYPGTLPVINSEAVKKVLSVGSAIGGMLANFTEFDRKNYFYPDIPKGYQISQYKYPLVSGGTIAGVMLTRIHLEEDTARSQHESGEYSLIDFNRAGVPLMELVTEPVIHSSAEAMSFARELKLLLNYLDVSDANMEKGEMRVEVNISVSNTDVLGTKVEVKNINSFKAAGKAIDFEYERHKNLLLKGEKVIQETRGWDENRGQTFPQRSKEDAHDYRYFPDPDLPKLFVKNIPEFDVSLLKKNLPELPEEKRVRYKKDFNLKMDDIEMYIQNPKVADFFESVINILREKYKMIYNQSSIQVVSNYITSDLVGLSKNSSSDFSLGKVNAENFSELIFMIQSSLLSSRGGKDVLKVMFQSGGKPQEIAQDKGLVQKNDAQELKKIMEGIINQYPEVISEYKSGKASVLQFLIGQGMKETKGSANPELLRSILLEILK